MIINSWLGDMMCDPLDYWRGNTEVIEALSLRLSPRDLASLCQVSLGWREALNEDHVWWVLCRQTDPGAIELFGKVRKKAKSRYKIKYCLKLCTSSVV